MKGFGQIIGGILVFLFVIAIFGLAIYFGFKLFTWIF